MSKQDTLRLFEDLKPYVRHARYCKYTTYINDGGPDSDYCTCNLKQIVERIQTFLKNYE